MQLRMMTRPNLIEAFCLQEIPDPDEPLGAWCVMRALRKQPVPAVVDTPGAETIWALAHHLRDRMGANVAVQWTNPNRPYRIYASVRYETAGLAVYVTRPSNWYLTGGTVEPGRVQVAVRGVGIFEAKLSELMALRRITRRRVSASRPVWRQRTLRKRALRFPCRAIGLSSVVQERRRCTHPRSAAPSLPDDEAAQPSPRG